MVVGVTQLETVKSDFQQIEVLKHSSLGNLMLIDGDLQLTTADEFLYHEVRQ